MEATLNATESALVLRILKNYLPDLRQEVRETDNFDFRQALKADEEGVKAIIAHLETVTNATDTH